MRRLALVALCGLLAGGGAGALARKEPPRHHAARKHHRKPARHRPAKHRPATHRPAATTTPAVTPTVPDATTTPATTPTTPQDTTTPPPSTTPAAPLGHALGVTASDAPSGGFVLSLSRTVLGAGPELIEFRNISQDGHDLRVDAAGGAQQAAWDELASLADPVAQTVTLTAGTYRVYCTLHVGMERQLSVQ